MFLDLKDLGICYSEREFNITCNQGNETEEYTTLMEHGSVLPSKYVASFSPLNESKPRGIRNDIPNNLYNLLYLCYRNRRL